MFESNLLSWVVFVPLIGVAVLLVLPRVHDNVIRGVALVTTLLNFLVSLLLLQRFETNAALQFVERVPWIPAFDIEYYIGLDGISLWLVLLTTFLGPIIVLSTWSAVTDRVREFMVFYLILQAAMLGTFSAQDMVLFYVFWEAVLLPMALMIGIWGGERRIYAAVKFVLYTMVGSVLMLVAVLYMYSKAGSFSFAALAQTPFTFVEQAWLFGAFTLAFAIKVPVFPVHTWLPDAHVEAPTAGSVVLAGVMLKMGTYGLVRLSIPFFPLAVEEFAPLLAVLGVIGIVYGALVAMVQRDVKKLVAYSSVSHLGFVVLGLFAMSIEGVAGAIYVMLAHGLSTGMLFLLVGVIYERRHTRKISDFGGLAKVMPIYAFLFMIATLASVGLPGLSGFVGEFLVLMGAFKSLSLAGAQWFAVVGALGVILGAVYMLWMVQRVFFGEVKHDENRGLRDMSGREIALMVPLVIMIVVMGVYPKPWLSRMEPAIDAMLQTHERRVAEMQADAPALAGFLDPESDEQLEVRP
ncbi:MAG TPA: NADH-quinone oxidoreductase subunit M [Candidatus Krumholzibacteria bacterium]|nr:NADH-quinone oxidoreductase subunit M [Candidatus Krumholzibacteria bacterium]